MPIRRAHAEKPSLGFRGMVGGPEPFSVGFGGL